MTTQITWYNGITYTTTKLYDLYGFMTVMPCGQTVDSIVHQCLTEGRYENEAYGLPILLVQDQDRVELVAEKIAEIEGKWRNFGNYREARVNRMYVGDCGALGFVIIDNNDDKFQGAVFATLREVAEALVG